MKKAIENLNYTTSDVDGLVEQQKCSEYEKRVNELYSEWLEEDFGQMTEKTVWNAIAFYAESLTGDRYAFHQLSLGEAKNEINEIFAFNEKRALLRESFLYDCEVIEDYSNNRFFIVKEGSFKNTCLCECYGNYGRQLNCYDAGCYSRHNTDSNFHRHAFSELYEILGERQASKITQLREELEDDEAFRYFFTPRAFDVYVNISKTLLQKCKSFLAKWERENTEHTECEALTFWNGHNHESVVLGDECGESGLNFTFNHELDIEVLYEVLNYLENDKISDKYLISEAQFEGDWWLYEVEKIRR
jgi:hypothetical protein